MNLLLCFGLLFATPDLTQVEQQIKEHQRELHETQQQLEQARQRIEQLNAGEKTGLARIEAFENQVAVTRKYISQLDAQLAARTGEIVQIGREFEETTARIATRKQDLARRLTGIYKYGLLLPLQAVLSADRITDVYHRLSDLRWLVRADKKTAAELTRLQARETEERSRLLAARDELEKLKADRVKKKELFESSRQAESTMLSRMRTERDTKQEMEKQLNEAMQNLQSLISGLERQRAEQSGATASYFEQNKGKLSWPVRGKVLAGFGSQVHPLYKTKTNNSGIDIETASGVLALAIAAGKVAFADQFMGYGKLVILDHGGGFYTLYGNLEDILPGLGTTVTAGSPVGHTREYLHFEVRKQGQPVDPLGWLEP